MLINTMKSKPEVIPGTRILTEDFGLTGFQYTDPREPQRIWVLQYLLAPVPRRALRGVRARFVDSKGFVSFCNQRDLEVITGLANPGDQCHWLGPQEIYPGPGDKEWHGLCIDHEDLLDDLQDRELRLREQYPGVLPSNLEIVRRVHDDGSDSEELMQLLWDADVETGQGPDPRLETIERRWVRVERTKLSWIYADQ